MAVIYTPQQQKVIDLRNRNILVSAAAGSGKTAVLVERIIKMVCSEENPVDIDRLLIVTFTNAAAAEMRERIANGISKQLSEHPDSEHIQKQSTLLHNAQITTIDSFCLFLLRNHFNEIGLDPAFRIADEGEVKLLQQDVLQQLIEDSYASGDEAFRFCVEYFCPGGREKVLEQYILNLSQYAASFPWPKQWLEMRKEDYREATPEELCESDCGIFLRNHLKLMVEGYLAKLDKVRRLCEEPNGPYMYGELVEKELEQLEQLTRCQSLQEYEVKLPAIEFGRLPVKKDDSVSPIKRELAKEMRGEIKESIKKLSERYFATPLTLAAKQAAFCREPVITLIELVLEYDRRMREKKQEKKIVDFSDMEHYALEILWDRDGDKLSASPVAREYRQHFKEILTDEYQDSNLVQELMLQALSGEEEGNYNRFMVGDVKQSIYRFRLARPELFLEKYNQYQWDGRDCCRIDLAKNFRSRREVVDAVNDVFSRLMSETVGKIVYDENAALHPEAKFPDNTGCESELLLVEKPGKEDDLSSKQAEALAIANKIKELKSEFMVNQKGTDTLRPVEYSDIVILLRTNSGWDEEFKEVLEREGIPVYITSKTGYFEAREVRELLQMLRVLDNPKQDIPLFGVMKSLFGGFSEEEIALIRGKYKKCSLYDALKKYMQDVCEDAEGAQEHALSEQALREKVCGFTEMIRKYRSLTVYMPIRELLTRIVEDFDYLNYVTALPAGGKRRANVEMLFTKASDFEKTSYFGLFHFIRYIEQLEKYDVDYGEADLLDENANVVRIMSIHKSKGLEFPVTFVSGLSKRFNMQDTNQSMIVDMDLGLATDYVDPVRRVRNKTLRRAAISQKLREDSLAEELRVLYVALTRAKEKLILTGAVSKAELTWEKWLESPNERLSYLDFMEASGYLDFLLPILPNTSIRVSLVKREEMIAEEVEEQVQMYGRRKSLEQAGEFADGEAAEELKAKLNAIYPHAGLAGLYTKTTVSELKIAAMAQKDEAAYHVFEEREVEEYIPSFRRGEETVTGTVRGNAYHRVMEILDFDGILCKALGLSKPQEAANIKDYQAYTELLEGNELTKAVQDFLQNMVFEKRLSEEYYQAVRIQKIVKFLTSLPGYRMWCAHQRGQLYREQPFVLGIDARRLSTDFPDKETVLIQGIIDVFFVEEDGLVLLDYKTDAISSMEELWKRYETQLDYYQEALQKMMEMPVKERILYSFRLEEY